MVWIMSKIKGAGRVGDGGRMTLGEGVVKEKQKRRSGYTSHVLTPLLFLTKFLFPSSPNPLWQKFRGDLPWWFQMWPRGSHYFQFLSYSFIPMYIYSFILISIHLHLQRAIYRLREIKWQSLFPISLLSSQEVPIR